MITRELWVRSHSEMLPIVPYLAANEGRVPLNQLQSATLDVSRHVMSSCPETVTMYVSFGVGVHQRDGFNVHVNG